jgi:hypothetical protein
MKLFFVKIYDDNVKDPYIRNGKKWEKYTKSYILAHFFKSGCDGSYWRIYDYDRPNKSYGDYDNLPLIVKRYIKN